MWQYCTAITSSCRMQESALVSEQGTTQLRITKVRYVSCNARSKLKYLSLGAAHCCQSLRQRNGLASPEKEEVATFDAVM
jgi:hypothetical protein